jgi:hypothetical protein
MPARWLRRVAFASGLLLFVSSPVSAHNPTSGGSRGSFTSDQRVTYKYADTYPSWVTSAVDEAFQTYYADSTWNNSLAPTLSYSTSGTALVTYSSSRTSPCTGSPNWLACAQNGGTSGFRVYLRNLASAPHPDDWGWYENDSSCSGDSVCFYAKRSLLHELGHAVFTFDHDGQGEDYTVMGSVQPAASAKGWNRRVWQRCDQAAAQLLWGARDVAGPIAECMDHVAGAGSNGLNTAVTLSASATTVCINEGVTLSGSLKIATNTNYGRLSGDPLGSRTVTIKRDGVTWVTRTTGSTSGTYSATASFSTAGSRSYVTSFPNERSGALTGDTSPTVTVTWSTAC